MLEKTLMLVSMLALAGAPALAQTTVPTTPPAPVGATTPAAAKYDITMPVEQLEANPATLAIMERNLPAFRQHPAYEQIKGLSLGDIAPLSGGAITDAMLAKIDAELKAVK